MMAPENSRMLLSLMLPLLIGIQLVGVVGEMGQPRDGRSSLLTYIEDHLLNKSQSVNAGSNFNGTSEMKEQSGGLEDKKKNETSVALYKEPNNWLISLLKAFFQDIDWDTIGRARDQVERFVRRVDHLLNAFSPNPRADQAMRFGWLLGTGGPKVNTAKLDDAANIKAMLERVACFVGYMRILNNSNEALAELDAAKVISNLFAASAKNPGGFFGSLFG